MRRWRRLGSHVGEQPSEEGVGGERLAEHLSDAPATSELVVNRTGGR